MTSETFAGTRGRKIHWTSWEPADPGSAGGIIAIVHGFGEHSGRYDHVADRLARDGWAVVALDHHGHGRSEGPRGRISFPEAVADIDRLVDLAVERRPGLPVVLLGHSMGGALALRYALAHPDRLSGLIVSGPLVQVEGRAAAQLLGRVLGRLVPNLPLARLDPNLISRDPDVVRAYIEDPLVFHQPLPAATVSEFLRYAATLPGEVDRVRLPTLLMYGTEDGLCSPQGAVLVSQRIGATDLTTKPYDGLYHEILNEPERERVLDDVCGWLAAHSAHSAQTVSG
ncbi:MAG TPA: lysophospholipase [Solirubrobacteraceae bacterium]|jgi:alpha-beta hydrolase superfamily lysophospholipase|nr:lysophospholipase [Solirubrobacteraceae bacterium]